MAFDRKLKLAAVSILLIVGGVVIFRILQPDPIPVANADSASPADASAIAEANAEVFRRIFWRQPGEADQIIQSSRRERATGEGEPVQWDWFLAVDPSVAFVDYLIQENPFELTLWDDQIDLADTPDWFPKSPSGYAVHRSLSGEMTVLVNAENQRIYAWNQARAFQPAVQLPEVPSVPSSNQNAGRLPDARPPIPE